MARHSAARDQEIWETAQAAIERLCAAGETGLTPRDIFGAEEQREFWATSFLRRLSEAKLVISRAGMAGGRSNRAKTYFATAALAVLTEDPSRLEELVWPRGATLSPDLSAQELLEFEEEPEGEPPAEEKQDDGLMPTEGIEEQMKWIVEKRALTEKVDALLKLGLATFQMVEALRAELEGLKRAWE
jgi:hypothetical protein